MIVIGGNPFYKEKPEENVVEGQCKKCICYKADIKVCERYHMITEPAKTCKAFRSK